MKEVLYKGNFRVNGMAQFVVENEKGILIIMDNGIQTQLKHEDHIWKIHDTKIEYWCKEA